MKTIIYLAAVALSLIAVVQGRSEPIFEPPCMEDALCGDGEVCVIHDGEVDGMCAHRGLSAFQPCEKDSTPCADGLTCVMGRGAARGRGLCLPN